MAEPLTNQRRLEHIRICHTLIKCTYIVHLNQLMLNSSASCDESLHSLEEESERHRIQAKLQCEVSTIMISGAMSTAVGSLRFIKSKVTKTSRATLWSTSCFSLPTSLTDMLISFSSEYLQSLLAKSVNSCFNGPVIIMLYWTPNWPDLNPIENCQEE